MIFSVQAPSQPVCQDKSKTMGKRASDCCTCEGKMSKCGFCMRNAAPKRQHLGGMVAKDPERDGIPEGIVEEVDASQPSLAVSPPAQHSQVVKPLERCHRSAKSRRAHEVVALLEAAGAVEDVEAILVQAIVVLDKKLPGFQSNLQRQLVTKPDAICQCCSSLVASLGILPHIHTAHPPKGVEQVRRLLD